MSDELKRRAEDQPLPIPNDLPSMHDLVIRDILARKNLGLRRYGTVLQPFNGRSYLRDVYEELLDAAAYCRGLIWEEENARAIGTKTERGGGEDRGSEGSRDESRDRDRDSGSSNSSDQTAGEEQ